MYGLLAYCLFERNTENTVQRAMFDDNNYSVLMTALVMDRV